MSTINKRQLCEMVAVDLGKKHNEIEAVVNGTLKQIMRQVRAGREVQFMGFGKFLKRFRQGREMWNPGTGGKMRTTDKYFPVFKAGADFKTTVE